MVRLIQLSAHVPCQLLQVEQVHLQLKVWTVQFPAVIQYY
jgi:hypothetical protein